MSALPRMTVAEAYRRTRLELLDLAARLDEDQAARRVPACPDWTVKDVYAHLTGVACDILERRTDGVATPPWTARQVESRRQASLAEVCAEWTLAGPKVEAFLAEREGVASVARAAFDIWTHEQDVRGALGQRGVRDDERVRWMTAHMTAMLSRRLEEAGTLALRVGDTLLGGQSPGAAVSAEGELSGAPSDAPGATLAVSDYELLRIVFGRRSEQQILAADWDGDPGPYLDYLHVFPLAVADIVD